MMMQFLRACAPALVAGVLIAMLASLSAAPSQRPLVELLRSTHIHGLAVDRSDPGRLLIATHHGLHALQIDNGATVPLSVDRDDFMGFTPHPADADILYASGHPAGGGNLGFIVSTDGGRTWEMLSAGAAGPVDFHQMDISKADPKVIYGVYGDLQVSRDGGRSWNRVGPVPEGLIDLAASAKDTARLYAATQQGLVVSQDGGQNWQPAHSLPRPASLVETTADGAVYAFMLGSGLLRAEEPSLSWTTLSNGFGDRYLLHLAVDPGDHDRLFASTQHNELLASRDGGRSWQRLAAP
jgi:photosystem II stability/assembly factor-like uncharacterized protein